MKNQLLKMSIALTCALVVLSTSVLATTPNQVAYAETGTPVVNTTIETEQQPSIATEQQGLENEITTEVEPNSTTGTEEVEATKPGYQVATLTRHSKSYKLNGETKELNQPVTEKNGVTYIPLKAIAEIYGFKVSYDSKAKESIAASDELTLAFKLNSTQVKINNTEIKEIPATMTMNSSLMVPVRAWSQLTNTTLTLTETEIKLEWQVGPSAAFKVKNTTIFQNQTLIEYEDLATSPNGAAIVEEKWTGKEDIFTTVGKHTITRQVKDELGVWSAPYSVTIDVLKENLPPVANFSTNKETYKLGEPITYTDLSTDDYKIKSVKWSNNEPVFFTSGNKVVSIEVEDIYGLKSTFSKAIFVLDEQLYSKEEYYYNFTQQGYKLNVDHQLALQATTIPYTIAPFENTTVVRLNSPEQVSKAGIDYTDTIDAGKIRFALHKQNKTDTPYQLSLFATNHNDYPVFVTNDNFAMGGPALYVNQSGKVATTNYFNNLVSPKANEIIEVLPGETVELLPKEGQVAIQKDRTISIFSDYTTSGPLQFTSLISEAGKQPINELQTLTQLPHDNTHIRGTFKNADRKLYFNHVFGSYSLERIVLGDKVYDQNITGVDAITGNEIVNAGNGAVKYGFTLEIQPNTIVLLNGRGGIYAGSLLVNNKVVNLTEDGFLASSTEAAVIYRTGSERELINVSYLPAPGSNLPLSIIFDEVPVIEVEDINIPKLNYTKK